MKTLILLLTLLVAATAFAADPKPDYKYDPNSPAALAVEAKLESYKRDGQALRTYDLYTELIRLNAAHDSSDPRSRSLLGFTDYFTRALAYESELKKRGESGDPYASFYYAVNMWHLCSRFQQAGDDEMAKAAKECWQRVMPAFKRASDAQIAAATFNIARLYQNGFGVTQSKLVAAEWFVKSADQYNKEKARDEALTALELALNLAPDLPAALRLRKAMLK